MVYLRSCLQKFILIIWLVPISASQVKSQQLTALFKHQNNQYVYLSEVLFGRAYKVDSTKIDNYKASFSTKSHPVGYYQLSLNDTNYVDIILNNEDSVIVQFNDSLLRNGVEVISSKENTVLWKYKYYSKKVQELQKEVLIHRSYLQEGDSLFDRLNDQYNTLEAMREGFLIQLAKDNPSTFFTKTVYAAKPPLPKQGETAKQVHFRNVDFSDPSLIRSSIFSGSVLQYFQLYTDYTEEGFQESVDYVLALANANNQVYEYTLNFLLELFNAVGPDIIFDYIIENYLLDGGCTNDNIAENFIEITQEYRNLLPGKPAPEFSIEDTTGKAIESNTLWTNQHNLLFFWSSRCGHCHEQIPELKKLVNENNKLNIIAISLDDNRDDWLTYIKENSMNFYHFSDLKGWDGTVHKKYRIHKTPSYYLMNQVGIITQKPKTVEELRAFLVD